MAVFTNKKLHQELSISRFIIPSNSNGKEKDYESGFHYYGARYYWSVLLTSWLSVDPMADKYPSISPYAYCAWNPVKLVDPDGKDPIYGMIWFNLRKIGDDGQTNGKAYFVTGGKKISVLFSHIRGRTYSGSLMPSENVFSVPTGEIAKDVQATIEMVKQSGDSPDSQVEFGAHAIRGARNAIIWDPGEPMRSEENGTRRWSITPFVKNGKPIGGNPADVEFVWHVQPTSSKPSAADLDAVFDQTHNRDMKNSTWFVVGAQDNKVSFLSGLGKRHTIDMTDFQRMSRQQ